MQNEAPFVSLYIDGEYRPASNGARFRFTNAYTHKVAGHAAAATSQDCKDAIDAAHRAFLTWEKSPLLQRVEIIYKASLLLDSPKYKEKVQQAMRDETSAMDEMSFFSTTYPAMVMRIVSGMIHLLKGETFPSSFPGGQTMVQRRPKGVILGISPWNSPILLTLRTVVVPILCGNTVVLKCSEVSPRSQSIVSEIFHEAGLPRGVLNFLSIDKKDAPHLVAEIIANPLLQLVTFTGSDHVARLIASEAAKHLKPCIFELGGKCPAIVLNDADVAKAAKAIAFGVIMHTGQVCISTSRLIVQRSMSEQVISAVVETMRKFKAGDPVNDPEAKLTALFSEEHAERVVNTISDAVKGGAKVLLGDVKRDGAVVQPHVLTGVKPGMQLWEKETFGPVLIVSVVDTVDEAIELANTSTYTLGATLWTNDLKISMDVISRVRTGLLVINGQQIFQEAFGESEGLGGSSGYGGFGVEDFTDRRVVVFFPPGDLHLPLVG